MSLNGSVINTKEFLGKGHNVNFVRFPFRTFFVHESIKLNTGSSKVAF